MPQNLTKRQKELLEEFKEDEDLKKSSPQSHGFFAKVKEFFEDLTD